MLIIHCCNHYYQSLQMRSGLAYLTETFERVQKNCKKSTSIQISNYQLSFDLFELYNNETMSKEWLHLNDEMILGGSQTKLLMLKNNQSKIGMKVNKFYVLYNKIELSDLEKSLNCYKHFTCRIRRLLTGSHSRAV